MSKNVYLLLAVLFLLAIIITGGVIIWSRYSPSQPIEISLPPQPQVEGDIFVGGAVNNPGLYPFQADDSLEGIIRVAGGTSAKSDSTHLKLYVIESGEEDQPQKIDINRAEAWLLEALPGIGETKAQAIIDYREQNGAFRSASELTSVNGIGTATYEQIKGLITVAE